MLRTEREKRICEKYSKYDEHNKVHCFECPNRIKIDGIYEYGMCKFNFTWNKHKRQWEED